MTLARRCADRNITARPMQPLCAKRPKRPISSSSRCELAALCDVCDLRICWLSRTLREGLTAQHADCGDRGA
jgi:hypothetical protein